MAHYDEQREKNHTPCKPCPECYTVQPNATKKCSHCNHVFGHPTIQEVMDDADGTKEAGLDNPLNSLAQCLQDTCCGTTCDKQPLVQHVAELEKRCADMQEELDEVYRLRENKEAFAKKCFDAGWSEGWDSGFVSETDSQNRDWLNFKATEL